MPAVDESKAKSGKSPFCFVEQDMSICEIACIQRSVIMECLSLPCCDRPLDCFGSRDVEEMSGVVTSLYVKELALLFFRRRDSPTTFKPFDCDAEGLRIDRWMDGWSIDPNKMERCH